MNSIWLKRILFIALILAFIFPFAALVVDAAPPQQGGNIMYIVRPGDTLFWIAQRFGTTVLAIMSANGLASDQIQAGQRLAIPVAWNPYYYPFGGSIFAPQPLPAITPLANPTFDCSYTVQPGDTVFSIAYRHRVAVPALMQANGLSSALIFALRPLKVPCGTSAQNFPTYIVPAGDNLFRIAVRNSTTIYALQLVNGIPNPHIIFAGQTIIIPYPNSYTWTITSTVGLDHIVISQFRTRGPNGGFDEFIELYNSTANQVSIGNWTIRGSSVNGVTDVRVTIPNDTLLNPGQHFLLTNKSPSGYSGLVTTDLEYTTGIADDGGIALVNAEGTIVDQVGMSAGSAYKEASPLAPLTSNTDRSYERRQGGSNGNCSDTGNNAADFKLNDPSAPRNRNSTAVTCSSVATATPNANITPGSGTPTRTPTATATTQASITFIMQNRSFSPAQINNIVAGTVIRWQNSDAEAHSVRSGMPGNATSLFNSGVMQPGASFAFTVTMAPGTYPFFCELHGSSETGSFVVVQ